MNYDNLDDKNKNKNKNNGSTHTIFQAWHYYSCFVVVFLQSFFSWKNSTIFKIKSSRLFFSGNYCLAIHVWFVAVVVVVVVVVFVAVVDIFMFYEISLKIIIFLNIFIFFDKLPFLSLSLQLPVDSVGRFCHVFVPIQSCHIYFDLYGIWFLSLFFFRYFKTFQNNPVEMSFENLSFFLFLYHFFREKKFVFFLQKRWWWWFLLLVFSL